MNPTSKRFRVSLVGLAEVAALTALSALTVSDLGAQDPKVLPGSDSAAIEIIKRHTKALGEGPVAEYSHWIEETQFDDGPITRSEIHMGPSSKLAMRMTTGGQVMLEFGFDGTAGWSFTPGTGVTTLEGAALEVLRESISSVRRPPRSAMRLVHRGWLKLEEEFVNHVLMIDAASDTTQMYYSMATGLLFAMEVSTAEAKAGPQFFFFRDYKPFGGRQTPTLITMLARGPVKGVQRAVLLGNDSIPDERFRRPAKPNPR